MFPDLEAQQQKIQEQLALQTIESDAANGAIKIVLNAIPEIKDISIDRSKINIVESGELEDLLVIAINEGILKAQIVQAEISQKAISDMIPGGLGNLKGLFGG